MGLLNKLFGRSDSEQPGMEEVACPHMTLTARWDSVDDIGKHDRATGFHCEGCGADFSGDEGRRLLH